MLRNRLESLNRALAPDRGPRHTGRTGSVGRQGDVGARGGYLAACTDVERVGAEWRQPASSTSFATFSAGSGIPAISAATLPEATR